MNRLSGRPGWPRLDIMSGIRDVITVRCQAGRDSGDQWSWNFVFFQAAKLFPKIKPYGGRSRSGAAWIRGSQSLIYWMALAYPKPHGGTPRVAEWEKKVSGHCGKAASTSSSRLSGCALASRSPSVSEGTSGAELGQWWRGSHIRTGWDTRAGRCPLSLECRLPSHLLLPS